MKKRGAGRERADDELCLYDSLDKGWCRRGFKINTENQLVVDHISNRRWVGVCQMGMSDLYARSMGNLGEGDLQGQ